MKRRARWTVLLTAGFLSILGCTPRATVYEGLSASRAESFRRWLEVGERSRKAEPLLEGDLSLADAVKFALLHNKKLQAVLQRKEIADGRALESYSGVLPGISGQASYIRNQDGVELGLPGMAVPLGSLDEYAVSLEVRQPLFRGGASFARIRAARLLRYLADEEVRNDIQDTIESVAESYYDVLLARHLAETNSAAVESAEENLREVKAKREQGLASNYDVLRAEVDLSNFKAQMIQQQNRRNLARASLLKSMGAAQVSGVRLSDPLAHVPMEPVFREAVGIAYENRPDLYAAELDVRVQEEALRIARSRYFPQVDAVFNQVWGRPEPRLFGNPDEWEGFWFAGVRATWPVFDGLGREGRVMQEKASLVQKRRELLDTQERVVLEVQQAVLSLRDAEELVASQALNLTRAQEALNLIMERYRQGLSDLVQVTDGRAALTEARGFYYQAVYVHSIARLRLHRALGTLGPKAGDRTHDDKAYVEPGKLDRFTVEEPAED